MARHQARTTYRPKSSSVVNRRCWNLFMICVAAKVKGWYRSICVMWRSSLCTITGAFLCWVLWVKFLQKLFWCDCMSLLRAFIHSHNVGSGLSDISLHQLQEKYRKKQIAFIDITKTVNLVSRRGLYQLQKKWLATTAAQHSFMTWRILSIMMEKFLNHLQSRVVWSKVAS